MQDLPRASVIFNSRPAPAPICLAACCIPLPVISPIKNLDARTKAIALWLWSTDSVYHKIRDCMLSDSPNGALVAQEVDKIAVALAHSCRDTPNRDTDTWRGIDVDQARLESIVTDLRNRPFSMKSFAATSARRDVAMGFGPVLLKFENVPKKYLGDVSTHPEEAEFLIPPWQKVRFLCRTRDAFVFTADS
ncbi:hypothetical protein Pelo_5907 [Pelomyxa schiedti]|nr:hypothetical protein Pelo_5907 [Pelomyxa schiedti]